MEESSKWAANQPSLQRLQALTTSLKSDLDQSQAMEASAQERRMQRMGAAKRTGRAATGGAAEDISGVRSTRAVQLMAGSKGATGKKGRTGADSTAQSLALLQAENEQLRSELADADARIEKLTSDDSKQRASYVRRELGYKMQIDRLKELEKKVVAYQGDSDVKGMAQVSSLIGELNFKVAEMHQLLQEERHKQQVLEARQKESEKLRAAQIAMGFEDTSRSTKVNTGDLLSSDAVPEQWLQQARAVTKELDHNRAYLEAMHASHQHLRKEYRKLHALADLHDDDVRALADKVVAFKSENRRLQQALEESVRYSATLQTKLERAEIGAKLRRAPAASNNSRHGSVHGSDLNGAGEGIGLGGMEASFDLDADELHSNFLRTGEPANEHSSSDFADGVSAADIAQRPKITIARLRRQLHIAQTRIAAMRRAQVVETAGRTELEQLLVDNLRIIKSEVAAARNSTNSPGRRRHRASDVALLEMDDRAKAAVVDMLLSKQRVITAIQTLMDKAHICDGPAAETPSDASEYAHIEGIGGFRRAATPNMPSRPSFRGPPDLQQRPHSTDGRMCGSLPPRVGL